MKYFLDTEFNEDFHKPFLGKRRHFIDLISIGIVAEDGRGYYEISKNFDLKAAWNKYQQRTGEGDRNNIEPNHWIRENVLKSIFIYLKELYKKDLSKMERLNVNHIQRKKYWLFNYENLKWLLNRYGKSNNVIANEICAFIYGDDCGGSGMSAIEMAYKYDISDKSKLPEFYAYFADYDWVVFCSLFGSMIDLPKGFPMYCKDLKQDLDRVTRSVMNMWGNYGFLEAPDFNEALIYIKTEYPYPKQYKEHNALDDAKWNFRLYDFLSNF